MRHRLRSSHRIPAPNFQPRSRATRAAEDELFTLMDDLAAGRSQAMAPDHVAPEILAVAQETQEALASGSAHLDENRQQRIWEEIMMNTTLPEASSVSTGTALRHGVHTSARPSSSPYYSLPFSGMKWAPVVNTTAILVVVVAIILGYAGRHGGLLREEHGGRHQLASIASPVASPSLTTEQCLSPDRTPEEPVSEPRATYDDDLQFLRLKVVDSQTAMEVLAAFQKVQSCRDAGLDS